MAANIRLSKPLRILSRVAGASAVATTTTLLVATMSNHTNNTASLEQNNKSSTNDSFQIETDFMERLAAKPYLQPSTRGAKSGLPSRLRILAIDVPKMRHAFDGECRINLSKVYSDGIAPSKILNDVNNEQDTQGGQDEEAAKQHQIAVLQKSLAKSLIKCRKHKKIGVELLEASVADLNPHNLRRTHQFGNYRYDPAKYASKSSTDGDDDNVEPSRSTTANDVAEEEEEPSQDDAQLKKQSTGSSSIQKETESGTVLATEEDELEAPWNQYAWIEELQIRVAGKVPFGAQLEPSSKLLRLWNGNVYRSTIPSSRSWWEYLLPPMFHRDPAGLDNGGSQSKAKKRRQTNWASNKPHAVIADGAALQRVPGSMRFLSKTCQEVGVPLFVVNDPRVWGGNTHQDLNDALRDMRKTIKHQIILQQSLGASAFRRGRLVGQMETEAKWQAKNAGRKTRERVEKVNKKLKEERERNWSQLSPQELEAKLVEHAVIQKTRKKQTTAYTPAMVDLARRCVDDVEEQEEGILGGSDEQAAGGEQRDSAATGEDKVAAA